MRSPIPPLLLLAVLLGVLSRGGHADTTTASATTAKGSPTVGTGATTTSSGVTKASASSSPSAATTPGTKVPPTAPSQTSMPTGASRQTPTSTDGPTKASNAPATSLTGVGTAKTTASAKITTAPGPVSLPTTSVTATPPPQTPGAPSPTDGSKETTSSLSTSAAGATNITPAPKTSKIPAEKTTARSAPTQGSSATTPGGVAVNQDSVTTASGQSASSLGGSVAPATPAARQNTPSEVPRASTSAKPEGTAGATVQQSHDKGSQPATLSPGATVVTTATEARPTQGGPPPGDQGNHTWLLTQTQFVCEEAIPSTSQAVVLTLNQSTPCDSFIKSSLEEPLLNMICKTLKPNFNRSRDHCLVRLAPVTGNPNALAIVGASVQINSEADELFESLKIKEGELKKLGLNVSYAGQYADIDSEDRFSMPLIITIVCMAASLLLAAAIYGCCHQRISQRKDQQRLTEELQTMENGYHDNPTLEVMETSSEMQEKKVNLNGELGDSWIVPMDSLTKEDLEEEEDTHL